MNITYNNIKAPNIMYVLFEIFSYEVDVVVDYYYVYVIVCGIIVTGAGVLFYV